jgi:hypothetical protein
MTGFRPFGPTQPSDRPREVEFTGLCFRHHAVKISARRRSEMCLEVGREDGDRRLVAAMPVQASRHTGILRHLVRRTASRLERNTLMVSVSAQK